ncbi:MAG TPA: ABC transporter substrate-binding protein [Anaerolineae bacterium]|nr:ABC transporter substrate-binding protein [Anaerolineae bacterium]
MKRNILVLVIGVIALIMGGCGVPLASAPTPTPAKKSGTIRMAFPTEADTGDVPALMAFELLKDEGYTVQPTFFANPDVSVAAVAKGDVDISHGSTRTHWAAVQKGGDIRTVMEQAADIWSLVTRPEFSKCADLDGRRVAVNSAGSISKALLDAYLKENCPNIKPEIVFISGSENRATAMQANQIDGTLLEVADILQLDHAAPGKYHSLINYSETFPKLKTTGVQVNGAFAAQHPDMVRDYLTALLTIHRRINENPQLLRDAFVKYLSMKPEDAKEITDAYLARRVWDVNGGLKADDVKYSIDFFTQSGSLEPGLTVEQVSDLSYLNAILEQIGRK